MLAITIVLFVVPHNQQIVTILQFFTYRISLFRNQNLNILKKTLINWSQEIINSFTFIDGRRITNGIMESKNGIAKEIKNNAKGYKNFLRYRNRCLYCMNKTTKPNYAGSHKSIRMKGWPRGRYKKNK